VTWIGPADQGFSNVTSGASAINQSFDPGANGLPKPTVTRVRGIISIKPQVFAADLDMSGAYGICVVSDEAFTAGAASIPRPFDDAGWDGWLLWGAFAMRLEIVGAGDDFFPANITQEIDSKGMRKVTDNETIVFMVESEAGAISVSWQARMLLMLS